MGLSGQDRDRATPREQQREAPWCCGGGGGEWTEQSLCLLFLGLWVNILGPDYGVTMSSTEPLPIPAPPLTRSRLPTAVTTSPLVALETLLRTGELGHSCLVTGGALPSALV